MINLIALILIFFAVKNIVSTGLVNNNLLLWGVSIFLMGISGYLSSLRRNDILKYQRVSFFFRNTSIGLLFTYGFGIYLLTAKTGKIAEFFNMNMYVGIGLLILSLAFSAR